MYDVIIIGAGPSGSLLATLLSNENIKVLLVEKQETPKYNACSGFLSRRAEKELGISVPLEIMDKQIKTVLFQLKDKKFPIYFQERFGTTIDRLKLDLFLRERAKNSKNVSFLNAKVVDVKAGFEHNSITLEDGQTIQGRYLVGADGYKSIVSDKVFDYDFLPKDLNYVALFEGVDLDTTSYRDDTVHLQMGDMEEYSYRIIFPYHRKYVVREGLETNREDIGELLKTLKLENDSEDLLIQTLVRGANEGINGKTNVILIGDAARLLDPISGEGLTNAFYSAKVAFQALKEAFRSGGKVYLGNAYDKLMAERYDEIALKMLWFKHMARGDFVSKIDESMIRDYIDTVMGKTTFSSFFYKYTLRKFPTSFFKSLFR